MTHARITIDNVVEFDGSVTEWSRKPPDMFRDQIKPDAQPKPWMKAIMIAMAEGVMTKKSMNITAWSVVVGSPKKDGWSMEVVYR